ncbi:hypothetical protein QBC34DRAFT_213542 [Podospora aff. communis PSN243]|uniref:Uncharacterized protein n=1 Tax=Podospora aff. communis PSN243 TaxID=3040156 RepID=A0AAV9G7N9_9PEZI|nr:hypothetical protein QBC34DRAFT_213542 [Podospora aff. communis PSN243]
MSESGKRNEGLPARLPHFDRRLAHGPPKCRFSHSHKLSHTTTPSFEDASRGRTQGDAPGKLALRTEDEITSFWPRGGRCPALRASQNVRQCIFRLIILLRRERQRLSLKVAEKQAAAWESGCTTQPELRVEDSRKLTRVNSPHSPPIPSSLTAACVLHAKSVQLHTNDGVVRETSGWSLAQRCPLTSVRQASHAGEQWQG